MEWKAKSKGGLLAVVGFILSPLSWWNDLVVNVPLAIGFGWVISWIYRPAFELAVVFGYWLTNVAGLFLMHKGIHLLRGQEQPGFRRELRRDLLIALGYTALIILLLKLGLVQSLVGLPLAPAD